MMKFKINKNTPVKNWVDEKVKRNEIELAKRIAQADEEWEAILRYWGADD